MNKEGALTNLLLIVLRTNLREPEQALLMQLSRSFGFPDCKLYDLIQVARTMPQNEVTQCLYENEQRRHLFAVQAHKIGPKRTVAQLYEHKGRTPHQNQRFPVKLNDELRREICTRFALGQKAPEVHKWLTQDKGIKCSIRAVYYYSERPRWRRYVKALRVSILGDPWLREMVEGFFRQMQEDWQRAIAAVFTADKNLDLKDYPQVLKIYYQVVGLRKDLHLF